MKPFIYLSVVALFSLSCNKSNDAKSAIATIKPSITSVVASPVYSGGNESVQFIVEVIADSTTVDDVTLYCYPGKQRWQIKKPSTGRYIMYDHVGDYTPQTKYNFTFHMHDGTVVDIDPFAIP